MTDRLKPRARLVVASHNPGKVWEIKELIAPYGLDAVSAADLDLPIPDETGDTFRGNAAIKADAAAEGAGLPALADDSGLEVDVLDGAPGVYSADWAGPGRNFAAAMQRVHDELDRRGAWTGAPPSASFISVLCLAWPGGVHRFFEGKVHGNLVWPPRGGNGFGYDPMFVPEGDHRTFGEMEPAEKHAISHRARAFERFRRDCLGEASAVRPRAEINAARDLEALAAAAANLSTRAELLCFIGNLRDDLARHPDRWKHVDLQAYLGHMEITLASAEEAPSEPPWRSLAKALLAARMRR